MPVKSENDPISREALSRSIAERLRAARESLGLSQKELAERAGIPVPSLKAYEAGKSIPGGEAILSLSRVGISADWLLSGQSPPAGGELVTIPLYPIQASAGGGSYGEEPPEQLEGFVVHRPWFLKAFHVPPEKTHFVEIRGDSMEPTLSEGDLVLVDTSAAAERPREEGIYILNIDGVIVAKRIAYGPPPIFRILSDNPAYPPVEVDAFRDNLQIVGRVRLVIRRM